MPTLDLSQNAWTLQGFRPFYWAMRPQWPERLARPEIGPLPARVPGSVHAALLAADLIPDYNVALNSRACEWLEHRHWEFSTTVGPFPAGTPISLHADGLDHSGWICVDAKPVAEFRGSLVRHRFDLTPALADGNEHRLSILFDEPPREQGQLGLTSRSRHFKPRFSYSWDWIPRIVPVGVWDQLTLHVGPAAGEIVRLRTTVDDDLRTARCSLLLGNADPRFTHARLTLTDPSGAAAATTTTPIRPGLNFLSLTAHDVQLWYPNLSGPQPLYAFSVDLLDDTGAPTPLPPRTVGFKHVRWLPNEGAPDGALPWICHINGTPTFLQGVNWTPVRADYASVTRADYDKLISLYKDMGCNTLRVWGGAYLERDDFYDLCDRAGLLVWQEFPLSSSGFDNCAPDDPAAIESLTAIATDYIRRRSHHACKLLWCGGNELCGNHRDIVPPHDPSGSSFILHPSSLPHDLSHPALAALADVVRREDPDTRFLPTSPSGPSFSADPARFGQGLHHDTHGPWNIHGTLDEWTAYWRDNDSLFVSEAGVPSTSPVEILDAYRGPLNTWPPDHTNPYWTHSSSWWVQYDRFKDQLASTSSPDGRSHSTDGGTDIPVCASPQGSDPSPLAQFVSLSQSQQTTCLAIAVRAMKSKFPRCGGFLLWMGHDCYPCPANTSIIDFHFHPKPAYHALKEIFLTPTP